MARIDGELANAQIESLVSLPAGPQPLNRIVALGTSLYTWNGSLWVQILNNANITPNFLFLTPSPISYLSGSGTYRSSYWFITSAANATVGATYTHNGVTFSVVRTIAAGTLLLLRATTAGTPLASGTLTKASGTGDTTIAFSLFRAPLYLTTEMVGGGGGGGGGGGAGVGSGGTGGTTTFGTSLFTCTGGVGGTGGASAVGGAGGTATLNSPGVGLGLSGGIGGSGTQIAQGTGGNGASSPFGGAGNGGVANANPGSSAIANTGSGGGGGSGTSTISGGAGGAGAYIKASIFNPANSYPYAVAAGGASGVAGALGAIGGVGGSGIIIVTDYFQ